LHHKNIGLGPHKSRTSRTQPDTGASPGESNTGANGKTNPRWIRLGRWWWPGLWLHTGKKGNTVRKYGINSDPSPADPWTWGHETPTVPLEAEFIFQGETWKFKTSNIDLIFWGIR